MKDLILELNKKVHGFGTIQVKSGYSDKYGLDKFDQFDYDEFMQSEIDNEKILGDKVKMLEEELQRTREESFQAGYQEGKEQGINEAKKQINDLRSLVTSFKEEYASSISKLETPII